MSEARRPFTPAEVMYAPAVAGVYLLWDREALIFIGEARSPDTVLSKLMDHYCGRAKPSNATHCGWEISDSAARWRRWLGQVGVHPEEAEYAETD